MLGPQSVSVLQCSEYPPLLGNRLKPAKIYARISAEESDSESFKDR